MISRICIKLNYGTSHEWQNHMAKYSIYMNLIKASQHEYEPDKNLPTCIGSLIVRMMEFWEVGSNERYVIVYVSLHIFVLLLSPMNFYWSIDLCASLLTNLLWWSFELLIAESHLCAGNLLEYFKDTLFSTIETYDV